MQMASEAVEEAKDRLYDAFYHELGPQAAQKFTKAISALVDAAISVRLERINKTQND